MICVGATYYRQGITNYLGEWKTVGGGSFGEWGTYSSVGPTYDGRIKPDVLAPGSNIISSYSSYYLANNPTANDIKWDVAHFDFNGRTYAWNSNTGTSMSSPAVAGAIALWMQAKPDLTMEEVMDVFAHTCHRPDAHATYPNNRHFLTLHGMTSYRSIYRSFIIFNVAVNNRFILTRKRMFLYLLGKKMMSIIVFSNNK
jgi:subtilisin family serine protease